jgi:hypothetical protein
VRTAASGGAGAGAGAVPVPEPAPAAPSQYASDRASDALAGGLLADAAAIMQRAEAEGRDPEAELHAAVSRTVLAGMVQGYGMAEDAAAAQEDTRDTQGGDDGAKRRRTDDD